MANNPNTGENQFGVAEQGLDSHAFLNSLTNLMATGGSKSQQTGTATTGSGTGDLQNLSSFFKNILGGGGNAQQELAPQNEQVLSQYDTARKALVTTNPRGGGSAEKNLELSTAPIGAANANMAAARGGAATGLADVGKSLAELGTQQFSAGTQAESSAGSIATQRNYTDATTGFGSSFKNAIGKDLAGLLTGQSITSGPGGTTASLLI